METLTSFEGLIEFAIDQEKKAQELYGKMLEVTKDPFARAILEGLREQEILHEEKLKSLLDSIKP
ncbi:MAG: hypothetical protein AB1640_24885 [bacterium]